MEIRQLSKQEYLSTFCDPMRQLEADELYRPAPLKDYVVECKRVKALGAKSITTNIPTVIRENLAEQAGLSNRG